MSPLLGAIHQTRIKIIYLPIGNFRTFKFPIPVAQNLKIVSVAEHLGQLLKGIGDVVKKSDAEENIDSKKVRTETTSSARRPSFRITESPPSISRGCLSPNTSSTNLTTS